MQLSQPVPCIGGNKASLGRNWLTAEQACTVNFGDCCRVDLRWNDGAYVYALYDTEDAAAECLRSLGWVA